MNSILREVHPASLANEIRMHKQGGIGRTYQSFLIVEGHGDLCFMKKFVAKNECLLMNGEGRENVIGAMWILEKEEVSGVLGMIDKDFGSFFPNEELPDNIVCTDENDVEMMILCSPALEEFLIQFGSEQKIQQVRTKTGKEPRDLIFEAASRIGAARVVSRREGWNLKFTGVGIRFQTNKSIDIDFEAQCSSILMQPTNGVKPAIQEFVDQANVLTESVSENRLLCRGHDCIRILGRGIRHLFGTMSEFESKKGEKNLERVLRLAYDQDYFRSTEIYSAMRGWEKRNQCRVFIGNSVSS